MIETQIDMRDFMRSIGVFETELQKTMQAGVDALAEQGAETARRLVPVKTGELKASTSVMNTEFVARQPGEVSAAFKARALYASYVDQGRGPVTAKRAGMLRFQIGGRWISKKSVRAAAARPFMTPAEEAVTAALPGVINDAINEAGRIAFGR